MKNGIEKKRYYFATKFQPNISNKKKLKILGKEFINKNKNRCKIIYKSRIYELKEYFEDLNINYNHKDLIKFKLIFIHHIIDMSHLFYNCDSLISLSVNNISNFPIYITNMKHMFYGCNSLKSLPDISKWDTCNVKDMSFMFYE